MKTVLEPSVWSQHPPAGGGCSQSLVAIFSMTERARHGHTDAKSRFGERSALPGAQPSTYSIEGFSCEHGNLDPSAGPAKPGRPTGPATSRTGGGASVVVRARESRAHGEGRQ
jgi:hypothetical protein